MSDDVTLHFNPRFESELLHSDQVRVWLARESDRVVRNVRAVTPRRTGRLAASERAELVARADGPEVHIAGHTRYADYVEAGTRRMAGRRYLERGLMDSLEG
jgi:hypothetical protein